MISILRFFKAKLARQNWSCYKGSDSRSGLSPFERSMRLHFPLFVVFTHLIFRYCERGLIADWIHNQSDDNSWLSLILLARLGWRMILLISA